jgi:hypothetical protein
MFQTFPLEWTAAGKSAQPRLSARVAAQASQLTNVCTISRESRLQDENRKTSKIALKMEQHRILCAFDSRNHKPVYQHNQCDPLYDKLKSYHDRLLATVSNITTEKVTEEVTQVRTITVQLLHLIPIS